MRVKISALSVLLMAAFVVSVPSCRAQDQSTKTIPAARPELAINYTYLRSNAPPGGCACFSLNGGSFDLAWPIRHSRYAVVGDITATHASGITSTGYDLTLSSYTFGGRYSPSIRRLPVQPFAQALLGLAHATGSLVQGPTSVAFNSGAALAFDVGGGANLKLDRRFALRLIEADYLLTTFDNGSNNRQNNLRIGAGIVFKF
jgi:peptidoglycan-associated lipoprotein